MWHRIIVIITKKFQQWVQMKFNEPMCLLGIKDNCSFEVFLPKKYLFHIKEIFNEIFCNLLLSY